MLVCQNRLSNLVFINLNSKNACYLKCKNVKMNFNIMMKKSLLLLLCLALVATACGGSAEETVEEPVATEEVETLEAPATTAAPTLDKIVFGFVPSAEQAELLDNIQPMMKVLSEGLGIEVEGFVTSDYSGLLVAMGSGQADVGAFAKL
mgnify:CR=1 FL=1